MFYSIYKDYHSILKILSEHYIIWDKEKNGIIAVSNQQIFDKTGFTKSDLHLKTAKLFSEDEVGYYNVSGIEGLHIKPKGLTSYANKKYLLERNGLMLSWFKDRLAIIVATIAIASTIGTAIYSYRTNKSDINKLKERLDTIESKK